MPERGYAVGLMTAPDFTGMITVTELKSTDRCDRCPLAQAKVRVQLPSGNLLDFCNHCYRKHELALLAQGANVVQIVGPEGE
jgi:hypothetical protein